MSFKFYALALATAMVMSATAAPVPRILSRSEIGKPKTELTDTKKAKKLESKRYKRALKERNPFLAQQRAPRQNAPGNVLYDVDFSFLTEGSPEDPAEIELDLYDNIPESLIGAENYGFGGDGIYSAGCQLYI